MLKLERNLGALAAFGARFCVVVGQHHGQDENDELHQAVLQLVSRIRSVLTPPYPQPPVLPVRPDGQATHLIGRRLVRSLLTQSATS